MSLVQDLARLRELSGKEPLPDPGVIQGFPHPGVPQYAQSPTDMPTDWLDPEIDGMPDEDPPPFIPSPLVPDRNFAQRAKPVAPVGVLEAPKLPACNLIVVDQIGAWKGREVSLSAEDEASIRAVVLNAIRREVENDLSAVQKPRRRRRRMTRLDTPVTAPEAPQKAPVKRRVKA